MPRSVRGAARLLGFALAAASLAACAPSAADPAPETLQVSAAPSPSATGGSPPAPVPEPVALAADRGRRSGGVVAVGGGDSAYNYAPSLVVEGGRHRMWWCSQLGVAQPDGDDVLYAEATSADGPFAAPDGSPARPVFSGSGSGFDAMHTCDPSVIKVGSVYYLYYTAAERDNVDNGSAVGVAVSSDGLTWTRWGSGPIITPSGEVIRDNVYGAGQVSALWLDGWVYLMFTDTTGAAAGWNGAGQFVLRSQDPTFATGVQALGPGGFTAAPDTRPRTRSIVDAFSADWMYVDALEAFVIAHSTEHGTTLTSWNRDFTANPHPPVHIPGPWAEGPGLVRTPTGHAPTSPEDPCGRVPVDVVRATVEGESGAPTALARFGLDLAGVPGCATEEAARVLDGFAVPSPENTVDLVLGGEVVRVERRSVADRLATRVLDRRPPAVDRLEVVERVPAGVPAVRAPDGQVGLLLEGDRLWLVDDAEVAALNSSPVTDVGQRAWAAYEKAGGLRR
ncbi:beta-xylosidase [Saccharothrix lopnurensis]|uniref:Beta-xylosidase n=1 Tax=Saccharothrix lopnurensis TaxID=1670621 RepID=A0ABW1NYY3_9PSEU